LAEAVTAPAAAALSLTIGSVAPTGIIKWTLNDDGWSRYARREVGLSAESLGPRAVGAGRRPVIAGLGLTEVGRVYDRSADDFAAEAIRRAATDAGLGLSQVDGLLLSSGVSGGVGLSLQADLGLRNLRFLTTMQAYGATAAEMVQVASMAVMSGTAETVVCVFADAPLRRGSAASAAYGPDRSLPGWRGFFSEAGIPSTNVYYALAARRHFEAFGTTSEQLGHVAVAQRSWAVDNPLAKYREPLTLAEHQASRWIAEPLHLLDCCQVSNGGAAVIVTSAERARALAQPPVSVLGWGQAHPGSALRRDDAFGLRTGAAESGPRALAMAGVGIEEVDVAELYDCYTYTVVVSLEDYGFCPKGEGGPFVAGGALDRGGALPVNTGGGQLSAYYLWGMTPLVEAVIQARGQGGARQVDGCETVLVSGNGGILDHHATLVFGAGER
jgi:acetyl-CoA acetyltransferase